jgi:signal recognition particle subunit SRP54
MGGMGGVMGMLPGVGKMKSQMAAAGIDDKMIKRQIAIVQSMTPFERRNPKELDGKRKRRIAAGSGTRPDEINRLLKMHRQMADMMKMMGKNPGMMAKMAGAMGLGGGMGMGGMGGVSGADMERMQAELARLDPKALESLPPEIRNMVPKKDAKPGLPAPTPAPKPSGGLPGLPGLGGFKLPALPFGKKPEPPTPGPPGGGKKK